MQCVNLRLVFGVLLPLFTIPANILQAGGARVTAHLKNGQEVTGELLVVTDHELLISKSLLTSEDKLKANPGEIFKLSTEEIQDLSFKGPSHLLDGLLLGSI